MSKVVVIGAGASGIVAALTASDNNEVTLIDGNDKCGKKILITGNGKCNYWNENINIDNYYSSDSNKLEKILNYKNEVLSYLESLGIYPKIKNGYYYPLSGVATSIREIFESELKRKKIDLKHNTKVLNIKKEDNKFIIETTNEKIISDKVIIATGSKACPKTGSVGLGYDLAKYFGHTINPVLPALVGLKTNDSVKEWSGVRTDASLSLYIDNNLVKKEDGEIQLTEDGISGICTFNLSSLVSKSLYKNKKVLMKINFMPSISDLCEFMENRNKMLSKRTIEELLESLLNYKLTTVILKKSNIKKDSYWNKLNVNEKKLLCQNISNFELPINATNSYDKAQVCTGGISLKEINDDMSSIYDSNLYFTGEILDVDGKCGGFNLSFAFITGYIAGKSV